MIERLTTPTCSRHSIGTKRARHVVWPVLLCTALTGCGSQTWDKDLVRARSLAAQDHRPVLAAFAKAWSPTCWRMDAHTLRQPDIQRQLTRFNCCRIDADRNRDLAEAFAIRQVPTFIVLHPDDGGLLTRCQGYQSPETFLTFLRLAEDLK